jgi:hypothetical protein
MRFWRHQEPVVADGVVTDGAVIVDPAAVRSDLRDAYEQGRRDERQRRRRSPAVAVVLTLAVVAVALALFYVAKEGSFSNAGAVVDTKVAQATAPAAPILNDAAAKTGAVMQNAGESLKDNGAALARSGGAQPTGAQTSPSGGAAQ